MSFLVSVASLEWVGIMLIVSCTNNSLAPHTQSLVVAKPDQAECNRLL